MAKKRTPRTHTRDHTKRLGKHHKRTTHYAKVYWPYLPLVISVIASLFLSFLHPSSGNTLAYATSMSRSGLLSATNSHRTANGRSALSLNSKLNSAAQAKANDMVARDYWSHTTPDGDEPWVFFDNAGYSYLKAGENLAYGFSTSATTVTGWKNSPTHNANQLDAGFSEVGFGYANSPNFNGDGQETVVVAMYGKPQTLGASTAPAASAPTSKPQTAVPVPAPSTPTTTKKPAAKPKTEKPKEVPVNTETPIEEIAPTTQSVAQVQTITEGKIPWSLAVTGSLLLGISLFKLLEHSLKFRHLMKNSRKFVLHHPLLDSTLLGLAILGVTLMQTAGNIL